MATSSAAGSGAAAVKATRHGVVPPEALAKAYDVVIIGGGPAGVAAAQKAAFLGRRSLLVDSAPCAPTALDVTLGAPTGLFSKALRDTAKSLDVDVLSRMGLDADIVWQQVLSSVTRLATNNAKTQMAMLSEFKIDYLRARAVLDPPSDSAGETTVVTCTLPDSSTHKISASHVLVATGSQPTRPDNLPFDDMRIFDSDSIAKLTFLPKRGVVVAGAGIIAIEYAKIFSRLHCPVTMLVRGEARSSLARIGLDTDIADGLLNDLAASGVTVLTNASADTFEHGESGLTVSLKGKDGSDTPAQIECDVFLAAMGRRPSSGGLGLAEIGGVIDAKSGVIKVENFKVEGAKSSIYAAGDVIGPPALASTGVEQAKAAIAAMFAEATEDAQVGSDNFPVGVWVSAAPAAQPVAPMPTVRSM